MVRIGGNVYNDDDDDDVKVLIDVKGSKPLSLRSLGSTLWLEHISPILMLSIYLLRQTCSGFTRTTLDLRSQR